MNVFDLFAKLSLDSTEYESGLDKAKRALGTMGKAVGVAIGAATAAVGALTKSAVESYAEYEQLVGGVETLFKDSADKVQEYAEIAYKTAGLSANEYMETVTSFSASLLQSLGGDTALAADVANRAITDMSDNANKMGTAMEAIQNAYNGFAKQNYTMLDNLKLGYGGTKEEMERLIEDASKMTDVQNELNVAVNAGDMSFANIVNAISVVQKNLGIMGTTAEEASKTISGSLSAMKSAWKNLVSGLANEQANIDKLINDFVDSAVTAAENLIPRIEKALQGIGQLVTKMAPIISQQLPAFVKQIIPPLISAATSIVQGLVEALPSILSALIDTLPGVITQITKVVIDMLPQIVELGVQLVLALAMGIAENIDEIMPALAEMILKIVEVLTNPETLTKMAWVAAVLVGSIAVGLFKAIPVLLEAVGELLGNVLVTLGEWTGELIRTVWNAVVKAANAAVQAVSEFFRKLWNEAIRWAEKFFNIGYDIVKGIWNGIKRAWDWLMKQWNDLWDNLLGGVRQLLGIHSPSKVFADIGKNMALGIGKGWDNTFGSIQKDITGSLDFGEASIVTPLQKQTKTTGTSVTTVDNQPLNITLTLDGTTLARVMYDYNKREAQLRGGAFA